MNNYINVDYVTKVECTHNVKEIFVPNKTT